MLTQEQITRLLDIANAGCHKGMVAEARTIYDGVLADRPGHLPARIGKAFSHIVVDDFEEAERILRDILASSPEDGDGLAYLGLCLLLSGRTEEAAEVLRSVPADAGQASVMAAALLERTA